MRGQRSGFPWVRHPQPLALTEPPSLSVGLCWSGSYSHGREGRPWVSGCWAGLWAPSSEDRGEGGRDWKCEPATPPGVCSGMRPGSYSQDLRGDLRCRPVLRSASQGVHLVLIPHTHAEKRSGHMVLGKQILWPVPKRTWCCQIRPCTGGDPNSALLAVSRVGKETLSSHFHLKKFPCKLDVSSCDQ